LIRLSLLGLVLVASACTSKPEGAAVEPSEEAVVPPPEIDIEEQVARAAVIEHLTGEWERPPLVVGLSDVSRTSYRLDPNAMPLSLPAELRALSFETWAAFARRNALAAPVDTARLGRVAGSIDPDRLGSMFSGGPHAGWEAFHAAYPDAGGFVVVSRVGISPDGAQALVYASRHRSPVRASGGWWLLRREGGEWVVEASVAEWVA